MCTAKEMNGVNSSERPDMSATQTMLKDAVDRVYGRFGSEQAASRYGDESLEEYRQRRQMRAPSVVIEYVCINMPCLYDELNILYDCLEALYRDNRVENMWEIPAFLRCKEDVTPEVYTGLCLLASDMADWMEDEKDYRTLIPLMSKRTSLEWPCLTR